MRYLIVIMLICGLLISGRCQEQTVKSHLVNITSSEFILYGTTNLNNFECHLVESDSTGSIAVKTQSSDYDLHFEGLKMKYAIEDFDCGLEAMSQDLRSTLKSKQFPYLTLKINDIKIKRQPQVIEKLSVTSYVTITLAGVTKDLEIHQGYVINHTQSALTLTGRRQLNMSDFNISPPSKFFGMVQVSDELSVGFEIHMEVQSE